jgi:hypothetical protein
MISCWTHQQSVGAQVTPSRQECQPSSRIRCKGVATIGSLTVVCNLHSLFVGPASDGLV